jgi:predicted RNase H-like nuclease (RuvC/YqgF family)
MANDSTERRISELEDEIKHRDRRISEQRGEIDELRDLVKRMEENVEDAGNIMESWREAFGIELVEDRWTWKPFRDEVYQLVNKYTDLTRRWNKLVPLINRQNVGRPLAASEAQCAQVLKLRKAGTSLRGIVEETNLGLGTVRTIVDKASNTDRTTKRHHRRLELESATSWKRQKRIGDALPKRAEGVFKTGRALLKEAKGLGRG